MRRQLNAEEMKTLELMRPEFDQLSCNVAFHLMEMMERCWQITKPMYDVMENIEETNAEGVTDETVGKYIKSFMLELYVDIENLAEQMDAFTQKRLLFRTMQMLAEAAHNEAHDREEEEEHAD